MRRLVVADAHVGQQAGDVERMVALVERLPEAGFGELVYLGDAFQYLIGMAKFWTPGVRRVIEAWQGARAAGVRIVLVEGNRDFFLTEPELATRVDWAGKVYELWAGKRRFRLVHGDRVNRRDYQYRFWSAVSKSAVARLWAHLLPRSVATAIVRHTEARLAATNFRFKYSKPLACLREEAARAWADGVDVLLWGHFHDRWEYRRDRRVAMVVPAWLESALVLVVEDDGGYALQSEAGTPPRLVDESLS